MLNRRGRITSSPFFLLITFVLNSVCYSQFYSHRLFPDFLANGKNCPQLSKYSTTIFYDHTYKYTINDTTLSRVYNARFSQDASLPIGYNSTLTIGHIYYKSYAGYKPYLIQQNLYTKQTGNIFKLGLFYYRKRFELDSQFLISSDKQIQDIQLAGTLKYPRVTIGLDYQSFSKTISGQFLADTISYKIKNYTTFSSYGIRADYKRGQLTVKIKMALKYPSLNEKKHNRNLDLDMGIFRAQYKSKIAYKIRDSITLWGLAYYNRDTSSVPIYWDSSKLGKFTAIDDTLRTARIGVNFYDHSFSVGTGRWAGELKLYSATYPFIAVWESLSGARYYLQSKGDLSFNGLFYSYHLVHSPWDVRIETALLNFKGKVIGKRYAISWVNFDPLELELLEVKIHKLNILETEITAMKNLTPRLTVLFQFNIFLPFDSRITTVPESKIDFIKNKGDERMSGGMQFWATLNYSFK